MNQVPLEHRVGALAGILDDLNESIRELIRSLPVPGRPVAPGEVVPGMFPSILEAAAARLIEYIEARDFKGVLVAESDITVSDSPTTIDVPEPLFLFWVTNKGANDLYLGINGTRRSKTVSGGEQFGFTIPAKVISRVQMYCDASITTTVEYYGMY